MTLNSARLVKQQRRFFGQPKWSGFNGEQESKIICMPSAGPIHIFGTPLSNKEWHPRRRAKRAISILYQSVRGKAAAGAITILLASERATEQCCWFQQGE